MTTVKCPECSGEVTPDSDYCPHCGTLFDFGKGARCSFHPEEEAAGVCIICRRTVCDGCGKKKRGRWFCTDHADVKVEQDWALVFQSSDINQAELVKSVLESTGQRVIGRNFGPNTAVWEGGGDSDLSRNALNRLAKVFVPIPEYEKAKETLKDWESSEHKRES